MRAASLSLLALLAFVCQPPTCRAQTAPSDVGATSATGSGGKSDDVLSPSTLPKPRQDVKEAPGTARINALSPDEERRLERARARSHETAKEAPRPAAEHRDARQAPVPKAEPASAAKAASTPAVPVRKSAAPIHRQAEREVHRGERAGRAAQLSRDAADLDRRGRVPRPSRRVSVDRPDRAPRIGDVIPPGVALYPLPPGYGPPQAAMRPPPYPREPDDDDGPPARRPFIEPF